MTWGEIGRTFVVLLPSFLVLLGLSMTLRQKQRTDARALWWSRMEWAADQIVGAVDPLAELSDGTARFDPSAEAHPGRAVAMAGLVSLATDKNRNDADRQLLHAIARTQLARFDRIAQRLGDANMNFVLRDRDAVTRGMILIGRVDVFAARAVLVLNEHSRRGRTATPEPWVRRLAATEHTVPQVTGPWSAPAVVNTQPPAESPEL